MSQHFLSQNSPQTATVDETSGSCEPGPSGQDAFNTQMEDVDDESQALSIHSNSNNGFCSNLSEGEDSDPQHSEDFTMGFLDDSVPVPFISKGATVVKCDANWAPFKSEKDFLACLPMGCLHNLVTRAAYTAETNCSDNLVKQLSDKPCPMSCPSTFQGQICKLLSFNLKETISVWNNNCLQMWLFGIILMNCSILMSTFNNNLEHYPHDPTSTKIHSLYQCFKWREDLACEYRVQMVASRAKHFYIFEPTELFSGNIVIPVFFYKYKGELFSNVSSLNTDRNGITVNGSLEIIIPANHKFVDPNLLVVDIEEFFQTYTEICLEDGKQLRNLCPKEMLETQEDGSKNSIPLPTPWQTRAAGRIIRHVPITLYADNTSGNGVRLPLPYGGTYSKGQKSSQSRKDVGLVGLLKDPYIALAPYGAIPGLHPTSSPAILAMFPQSFFPTQIFYMTKPVFTCEMQLKVIHELPSLAKDPGVVTPAGMQAQVDVL
ncbi:hypothetical protein PSTG_17002 [Puccinia striiformis f. sp. tritici PST-78]|uniref:Uncharacterized protein n=1 Tax=Puccinia striiformis f. sp. tritici PST-78 TaxID=1165861 RepID=A0A0L0URM4_9BASI|nr:hypothetical protein PSTG_17002 [Puccinia striiformis f. sp. tritici PST-78]